MSLLTKRETWRKPKALTAGRTPDLTSEEIVNVKRAIKVLRQRHDSYEALAPLMGVTRKALSHTVTRGRKPGVGLALRAARVAGVPLEEILSGAWPKEGACPMCGRRDEEGRT